MSFNFDNFVKSIREAPFQCGCGTIIAEKPRKYVKGVPKWYCPKCKKLK